jgi:hypothetical protein
MQQDKGGKKTVQISVRDNTRTTPWQDGAIKLRKRTLNKRAEYWRQQITTDEISESM